MRYLIVYDITDDGLRYKVAETLKDYGLTRIQYSAFIGFLRRNKLNSLIYDLKRLIGDSDENVQIYPICDTCFKGRREIGKHKKYVLEEKKDKVAYI
ncbi:MAG: CRISPR-associated endonuclease Cas2 [Candidatus Baldrarchaeia archaeon]|nr:CRISPR-associated endonuclease Cas2 [Candidatus Odinarchaeota archaeon]MDO8045770.1 CRISPR-associated endonuclease Cas2 [Candidatus Baldrarchaeota archaeon]